MKRFHVIQVLWVVLLLAGCSAGTQVTTPATVPANPPPSMPAAEAEEVDAEEASEEERLNHWMHLTGDDGAYVGVGTRRAYTALLKDRTPKQTVIVAVIDSGVDIHHEDINVWTNTDEVAGNGVDDDKNGYVDDTHGWNFIGGASGENVYYDTFEVTREYARLKGQYESVNPETLDEAGRAELAYFEEIRVAFNDEVRQMTEIYNNINAAAGMLDAANGIMGDFLGNADFTIEEVKKVSSAREDVKQAKSILEYFDQIDLSQSQLLDEKATFEGYLQKGLNPDFDPRSIVGDTYNDSEEQYYGNNDVIGPDAFHGTHVAGIIGAKRGNMLGIDGVADAVEIMAVRAVPKGDERDKDIANAIRYAVDNGAHVINMSFGKGFSPQKEVVDAAIAYAAANDVLMIHAAGNDGESNDSTMNFPTPILLEEAGEVDPWIEVGASSWEGPQKLAASFSNFGKQNVDVFAPGVDIYSTTPGNKYKHSDGTSMASPVVAGLAALIMAYYPDFSANEVKEILLSSAASYADQMVTQPGTESTQIAFGVLSRSGGIVNAYEALRLAEERAGR
ncbi:MAG: S8 family peptidase [Bacteroidota bacterium]